MEFLLSHWHCILPVAVIIIALFFMNRGNEKDKDVGNSGPESGRPNE
jgi:purine-cytosine permease-like protein